MVSNLLVPGGLGFIGSHTIVELFLATQANMLVIDDLSNCFDDVFERITTILEN